MIDALCWFFAVLGGAHFIRQLVESPRAKRAGLPRAVAHETKGKRRWE
jgi:hypothetical protein